ncbi:hypothetical protein EVJ58_g5182 [Rhodofomes roseus]|uniref:Uncharacterized protein n=1 Tax=Rhodofomes roseus TaxID=34475 RepID=A0A4Y9YG21_9APHY|nr:hypothetical protein EVJ58_g5182 [Rhodofomes roseus]
MTSSTSSNQTSMYVALYKIGDDRFHCALVVTPAQAKLRNVHVYQITNVDRTQPNNVGPWRNNHLIIDDLLKSSNFVGCVRLPDTEIPPEDVIGFIKEQEPEQGQTKLPSGAVWDCSQWVLRVLESFQEATDYNVDIKHLYAKVWILAEQLKEKHGANATKVHVIDLK